MLHLGQAALLLRGSQCADVSAAAEVRVQGSSRTRPRGMRLGALPAGRGSAEPEAAVTVPRLVAWWCATSDRRTVARLAGRTEEMLADLLDDHQD